MSELKLQDSLVSVIIPVYNVEKYLNRCIQSIVDQTYTNLEILLVDDGSPDRCPQMCDEWAKRDSRIRVIHKTNGGLSDARNAGLDCCLGEYIIFVDSDDYVHPEYVEYLSNLVVRYQADLGICDFDHETPTGHKIKLATNDGTIQVMNQRDALKAMCECSLFSNSACAKIFLRSLFDDVRFPVGRLYEDLATTYKLMLKAQNIVLGQRALYYYVRHGGSITTSAFSMRQMDAVYYAEEMCEQILKRWPSLKCSANARLFTTYIYCWKSIVLSAERTKEMETLEEMLYEKIKNVRANIWSGIFSRKMKYYLICSYLGMNLMVLCFHFENFLFRLIKIH